MEPKRSSTPLHLDRGSPSWPAELSDIDDAPEALWLRGRVELLGRRPRIAIVGTRAPTPYGEAQARRFASRFAQHGWCVVSGMARGIDASAHAAALDADGATIAVLGSGVDVPWPAGPLAERLGSAGLLVSEHAPGVGPRRQHFPRRNRLIAGLAQAVLVIEAAELSGSLITAHWAADQGREVFALPGRVDHPMARGCHRLIREGAQLIESPEELLEELGESGEPRGAGGSVGGASTAARAGAELERQCLGAQDVLQALRGETLSAQELSERTGREVGGLLTLLIELELAGAVARCPGGLYRLLAV